MTKPYDTASRTASCDEFEDSRVTEIAPACKSVPDDCLEFEVTLSGSSLTAKALRRR